MDVLASIPAHIWGCALESPQKKKMSKLTSPIRIHIAQSPVECKATELVSVHFLHAILDCSQQAKYGCVGLNPCAHLEKCVKVSTEKKKEKKR